jgi:hypothetical protein
MRVTHMTRFRVATFLIFVALVMSCSDDRRAPQAPTPTPTPQVPVTPPPPPNRWSLAGRVVDTVTGVPVPGAVLEPAGFPAVTADAAGEYAIQADTLPPDSSFTVTVRASGFITREAQVPSARGARTGVDISLIRDAAPFSLDFYRQLVRNATRTPEDLEPLLRWTTAPKFYMRTVEEGTARPVEAEVLALVQEWLLLGVSMWTGWTVPTFESGPEARGSQAGWIRVVFIRSDEPFCGTSFVGRNPGLITLALDVCDCGSRKVPPDTILHEVGHALGFWHVADRRSVMYPIDPGGCRPAELSAAEKHHAAIAFRRPNGSTDIDRDYTPADSSAPSRAGDATVVVD